MIHTHFTIVVKILLLLFVCVLLFSRETTKTATTTMVDAFLLPQSQYRQQQRQRQQQKLLNPSFSMLLPRQEQQQEQQEGSWHHEQRLPQRETSPHLGLFRREEELTPSTELFDTVQEQTKQSTAHHTTTSQWQNPTTRVRWLNKLYQRLSSFWMTMKNKNGNTNAWWSLSNISKTGWMKRIRQCTVVITMMFLIMFGSLLGGESGNYAWAAVSAGRAGGSFGPSSSSRPSMSRPPPTKSYSRPPPSRSYYNSPSPSRTRIRTRHVHHHYNHPSPPVHSSTQVYYVNTKPTPMSKAQILVGVGLVTGVVAYGVADHFRNSNNRHDGTSLWNDNNGYMSERTPLPTSSISSSLGYGISVLSLTVSLSVSNRDNDDNIDDTNDGAKSNSNSSILSKLRILSVNANTETRKGVQDLISSSTLELLRNENTINSVDLTCTNYNDYKIAEKQFNRISIMKRSKFDKETGTSKKVLNVFVVAFATVLYLKQK